MAWCCAPADLAAVEAIEACAGPLWDEPATSATPAGENPTLLTRPCAAWPAAKTHQTSLGGEGARPDAESQEDDGDGDQFGPPIRVQASWQLPSGEDVQPSASAGSQPSSAAGTGSAGSQPSVAARTGSAGSQPSAARTGSAGSQPSAAARTGSAGSQPSAVARTGSRRSEMPPEVKAELRAARMEQREQAKEQVRAFLEQNGFASVKSVRRHLVHRYYPLHAAVMANNEQLIQRLLRAGADPFKRDSLGRTPLELAQRINSRRSHRRAMEVLKRSTRNGKHWVPWLRTDASTAGAGPCAPDPAPAFASPRASPPAA